MKKLKIVFIGGFGYADIGDESMLTANRIYFKKLFPDSELMALSDNPEYTRKYHEVKSDYSIDHERKTYNIFLNRIVNASFLLIRIIVKIFNICALAMFRKKLFCVSNIYEIHEKVQHAVSWISLYLFSFVYKVKKGAGVLNELTKKDLDLIFNSDLIFNVGGGNLNTIYKRELYKKCLVYLIAKNFNKPVIVSGQTIGPLYGKIASWLLSYSLNKVDFVTLRDRGHSLKQLREIKVTGPLIEETVDDAYNLPFVSMIRRKEIFSKEQLNESDSYVGINIGNWNKMNLDRVRDVLTEVCDYCLESLKLKVVFIPMQYEAEGDDRIPLEIVKNNLNSQKHTKLLINEYNDMELKTIVSRMKFVVGSRYHFLVFSTTSEVPSIGIIYNEYYYRKIHGIMHMMGQEQYILKENELTFEGIKSQIDQLCCNEARIKKVLRDRKKMLFSKSLVSINKAEELLANHGK